MLPLIFLSIIGLAAANPIATDVEARTDNYAVRYVLPGESFPTFYDVQLFIDPGNHDNFTGTVAITILPLYETNRIRLHAMEMEILNITANSDLDPTNIFSSFDLATDDTHILTIDFTENLVTLRPYILTIDYVAHYAPNMFGVYVSTYQDDNGNTVNLVTTQFQPTFARRAFPCYDEPNQKAVFRSTVYAPAEYPVVRSNMPERSVPLKPDIAGYVKHEFEDTLVMSSYLLAYLVSNLQFIENDVNPIYRLPFRIYSRPGTQENAAFALDFGQRNLQSLEEYIDMPYAFPKMDKAAVPDFAAGAMENWGLVIYREVALLVQEGVTTTAVRQNIGRIICHENVHQWFGNEVSPQSWTYTWLNEGFANFFENFATDVNEPGWRMMDQFVVSMQAVFQSDAVLTVNPMTHEVYTPSEILGTFNAVAYQKSGSVIRMVQHFLTPEVFRRGLIIYINNMSRQAANPTHLYAGLQQALNESNHTVPYTLTNILERWTTQGGFPVITVTRTAAEAQSISVKQERFLTDPNLETFDRWHIPLNWVLSTNPDFTDTAPQGWVPPTIIAQAFDIPGLNEAEWYIVNKQQTGYYRVNYDVENWAALGRALVSSHETIHLLNRAQIVDDAFNLARNGRLDYQYAFELSRYLVNETDYVPWAAAAAAFTYLDVVLSGTPAFPLFQQYVLELSAPLYQQLGFNAAANEEHVTAFHRNIILNWNCRYGNADCVNTAQQLLAEYQSDTSQTLNPDIQTVVFCSGLRGGDENNFNFLWQQYLGSTDATEQSIYLNALGCSSNTELRTFYLNQVISDDSSVREQDRHTILVSVINSSPENMEAALDFIMEHFTEIQPRVQGLTGTTNILNALAARLTTQDHSDKIEEFYSRYENDFTAGELASVGAIRENIAASITWNTRNLASVEGWLRNNFSSATSMKVGFSLILSLLIALYNVL